jgi:uncharacterized protein
MKKKLTALASCLMAAALMLAGCGGSSSSSSASGSASGSAAASSVSKIRLATGGTSGTYYAYGGVIGQILGEATGISFDVQSTGASKANIGLVADGEVDMAIVQNDVMDYAYNGTDLFDGEKTDNFSSMAACYAEVCQVVANPASGISSFASTTLTKPTGTPIIRYGFILFSFISSYSFMSAVGAFPQAIITLSSI